MIRRTLNITDFFLRLVTFLLPLFAFAVAGYIRFGSGLIPLVTYNIDAADYFGLLLLTTVAWAIAAEHYGLIRAEVVLQRRVATRAGFLACGITFTVAMAATFFYRSASFSRLFTALSAIVLFLLLRISQYGFRRLLERARQQGTHSIGVLIVGTDEYAGRMARDLQDRNEILCAVAGFVHLPGQPVAISGAPVYELADVENWSTAPGINDVVLAIPPERFSEISRITTKLEHLCLPVRLRLDFGEGVFVREQLFDFGGLLLLDLSATPAESVMYLVMKRGFDLVFSTLVILLTSPLTLFIAVVIRWSSPGPILFQQERVGLNGQVFCMYKFRTMRVGELQESETRWTTSDDPRRTRIGQFLRRTNLDELPQFFNVLKGDMSVVGPRPERPYFVQKFLREVAKYQNRHYLKVGITGWAQVNGLRGNTSIAERVEHDLYYLRNWSFTFDLRIILLTLLRGFTDKNAY